MNRSRGIPPVIIGFVFFSCVCQVLADDIEGVRNSTRIKRDVPTREENHWAYMPPERPSLPAVKDSHWIRNAIDAFVLARLERENLVPSREADKQRLLRRVSLDLTGLPPSLEELDAFLADRSADAYEKVIDRLLCSPRYGERWSIPWLDAARYADSNGYQRDGRRVYWAYRDWVIQALNADLPFDQFTIEQIAGDLLAEPTRSQLIATGFHRGTMANVEAGTDPEEVRVLAVFDRVNTTAAIWLGTTLECAQCHDHKYDPFTQEEYYQLFAFFNNTEVEIETDKRERDFVGPKIDLPELGGDPLRQAELQTHVAKLKQTIAEFTTQVAEKQGPGTAEQPDNELEMLKSQLKTAEAELAAATPPTTLVMRELPEPRMTHLFKRGNFLNPGQEVSPGTPASLHTLPISNDRRLNRLDLARWLVDKNNPLTSRVTVNRIWSELFGRGLVESIEDFGSRGEQPSHGQLLDWLAREFIRRDWSQKQIVRLIVTSATYRQTTAMTPTHVERDPFNKLYARGPRHRLPAEFIRDNALSVAGLLSDKMYGPPVFPYQPPGVWNHVGRASNVWRTSSGEDLYRRGLYVNWRRTVPYPSFVNFDAPKREACTVLRSRSNTPLQALTLMNDPVYVEAAGAFALRLVTELHSEATTQQRVSYGFRLVTGRHPTADETAILVQRYHAERSHFRANPEAAQKLTAKWKLPDCVEQAEVAAWTLVANILLNLDEVITKG